MIIHSPIFSGSINQAESAYANLSGSFSGSFTGVGNFVGLEADSVDYANVTNKPTLVSGSSQVSYPDLSNIPSGIISSSAQIDTLFNIDGLVSGGGQQDYIPLFKSATELSSSYLYQDNNELKTFAPGINKGLGLSFINDEYFLGNSTSLTGSYVIANAREGIVTIKSNNYTNIQNKLSIGGLTMEDEALLVSGSIRATGGITATSFSGQINATNGVVSGSSQVDIMSTTNIPKLATTGSNIFVGTQVISGSLTVTGSATFTNIGPTILSGSISQVNLGDGNIIISDTPITSLNATAPLGIQNTIIGSDAGQSITDGYSNSFFGRSAGRDNTTGDNNTYIGLAAGQQNITGSSNTFLGSSAGQSNKASFNTFVGMNSGNNNNNGTQNTFVGYQSGVNNSVGNNNTFIGQRAGQFNESGSNNTLVGSETAASLAIGTANSFFGYQAGSSLTGGSMNVMLGFRAGKYQPGYISEIVNTGYSIFIGADASGVDGTTNQIVIGYNGVGNGTDTTTIGNDTTVATYLRGKLILSGSVAQEVTGSVNVNGGITATSFNGVINATNGVLSGSLQTQLPTGVVSGSSQVNADSITNFDTNVKDKLNTDLVVSGSASDVKTFLSLQNVTNESKATMFTSPTFTGTPEAPTAAANTNSTQIATTAYVQQELTDLIGGANAAFDTLIEISASLASGDSTLNTLVDGKLAKASNLSDLTDTSAARTNLGVAIGTNVQAYNATLAAVAGGTYSGDDSITTIGTVTAGSVTAILPSGVVSGSSQITYANISSIPAGIVSGSSQVTPLLPTGTVSGSSQIDVASTTGDIALGTRTSGNYVASLVAGTGVTLSNNSGEGATPTIAIGQAVATNSEVQFAKVGVGGASDATYELKVTGDIGATGDIVAYVSSDERLKNNVEVISNPIEKVQALRGVTWEWNDLASEAAKQSPNLGVIAQEVEQVLPQLVHDRENGFKGVDYAKLTGLLIEAIKEQQKQIDELKSRLK